MNVGQWLEQAKQQLAEAGISTARLDSLVLLEDTLNTNRTHLLAHLETQLSPETMEVLDEQLARRSRHEPLAYIRSKSEFYGREFIVSPAVLEPRPESEIMIETLLHWPGLPDQRRILDVGTGSGALGITAQLELPIAKVDLLDIDKSALKVAKMNVIKFATEQKTILADLLKTTTDAYDVLLCNLPYVPDNHTINQAAMHEPRLAIFGGPDGLDLYRQLFGQVQQLLHKPLLILCESLPPQHKTLEAIAYASGYRQQIEDDFIQGFILI